MTEVFRYEVIPSTSWFYLSTILMVSIYFKFNRFISIRNLDILMLALLAPGILIVQHSANARQFVEPDVIEWNEKVQNQELFEDDDETPFGKMNADGIKRLSPEELQAAKKRLKVLSDEFQVIKDFQFTGYVWLFVISGALMARMLADPFMIRRPLLEPNLEFSGLTFLTIVLLFFLIANIVAASASQEDIRVAEKGKDLATAQAPETNPVSSKGPGYSLLFLFPVVPTFVTDKHNEELTAEVPTGSAPNTSMVIVTKVMAIFGQLAIVVGIYLIGFQHFGNTRMGIGIVTLYLLLPYTAEMTGRIIHILPAAAMVWAVVCYRRPYWAGTFLGLAMGLAYYPLFLLPLWFSFYWHNGLRQFFVGFLTLILVLAVTLVFTSSDIAQFGQNLQIMFGIWTPIMDGLTGFWEEGATDSSYRIPVMATFFCLSVSFAAWPAQKDLGTLLSCSAALMLAVQFWNGFGGGLLMAWYLPLTLMTMFRPNLEDRTAISLSLEK